MGERLSKGTHAGTEKGPRIEIIFRDFSASVGFSGMKVISPPEMTFIDGR